MNNKQRNTLIVGLLALFLFLWYRKGQGFTKKGLKAMNPFSGEGISALYSPLPANPVAPPHVDPPGSTVTYPSAGLDPASKSAESSPAPPPASPTKSASKSGFTGSYHNPKTAFLTV